MERLVMQAVKADGAGEPMFTRLVVGVAAVYYFLLTAMYLLYVLWGGAADAYYLVSGDLPQLSRTGLALNVGMMLSIAFALVLGWRLVISCFFVFFRKRNEAKLSGRRLIVYALLAAPFVFGVLWKSIGQQNAIPVLTLMLVFPIAFNLFMYFKLSRR